VIDLKLTDDAEGVVIIESLAYSQGGTFSSRSVTPSSR
jgi:hypothetical protein